MPSFVSESDCWLIQDLHYWRHRFFFFFFIYIKKQNTWGMCLKERRTWIVNNTVIAASCTWDMEEKWVWTTELIFVWKETARKRWIQWADGPWPSKYQNTSLGPFLLNFLNSILTIKAFLFRFCFEAYFSSTYFTWIITLLCFENVMDVASLIKMFFILIPKTEKSIYFHPYYDISWHAC